MSFEAREHLGSGHQITVNNKGDKLHFIPFNLWVALGWRDREQIEVDLNKALKRVCATLRPEENQVELTIGESVSYDDLVIASGPDLASDEIPGSGPEGYTQSVCLADFGDSGVAFVAQPQIPPRNANWSSSGRRVHLAKIGFEKSFIRKVKRGMSEPFHESLALKALGIDKLKAAQAD